MISYFILSLLGLCTGLQASPFIRSLTNRLMKDYIPNELYPSTVSPLYYVVLLCFLGCIIIIKYIVLHKMIRNASNIRKLAAATITSLYTYILGGPLLGYITIAIPQTEWNAQNIYIWAWGGLNFINNPIAIISFLIFMLITHLLIETPILAAFFREIPFKRILLITFVANLASNVLFLIFAKAVALITGLEG